MIRNGVAVAELRPPEHPRAVSAARWRELMSTAPRPDRHFAEDIERARPAVEPPPAAWPS